MTPEQATQIIELLETISTTLMAIWIGVVAWYAWDLLKR